MVEAEALKWQEELVKKCEEVIRSGGEISIQFRHRNYKGQVTVVPIIRIYTDNQIVCDEVLLNK